MKKSPVRYRRKRGARPISRRFRHMMKCLEVFGIPLDRRPDKIIDLRLHEIKKNADSHIVSAQHDYSAPEPIQPAEDRGTEKG